MKEETGIKSGKRLFLSAMANLGCLIFAVRNAYLCNPLSETNNCGLKEDSVHSFTGRLGDQDEES